MTLVVERAFDYNYNNASLTHFAVGDVLPKDLENDPYALSFTKNPPYVAPKPGTPEAMLEAYNRRKRQELRDAADADAAETEAKEKAKAAEVARLQAVVQAHATGVGQIGEEHEETQEERAAAQVRAMTYQMPQDRDEAAAATKPAVVLEPTPSPITTKPQPMPPPITDEALDRARAEMQRAGKTSKRA